MPYYNYKKLLLKKKFTSEKKCKKEIKPYIKIDRKIIKFNDTEFFFL